MARPFRKGPPVDPTGSLLWDCVSSRARRSPPLSTLLGPVLIVLILCLVSTTNALTVIITFGDCVFSRDVAGYVNKTGLCNTTTGYLDLGNKGIVSLDPNLFEGMSGVEDLRLVNNQISFIPSGLFDPLTNLRHLNLGGNQISSLPDGVFDSLNNLEYLKIYRNPLAELRSGVFDRLERLQLIQMQFLALMSLSSGIFQALRNLRSLNLAGNQVSMLPDDIFNASSSLTELVLNSNQLSSLPAGMLVKMPSLTTLSLTNNQISSLPARFFNSTPLLQTLHLAGNDISSYDLSQSGLANCSRLRELDLSFNRISFVPPEFFNLMSEMSLLYLHNNQISNLTRGIFDPLTRLTRLELHDNQIVSLPSQIFDALVSLRELSLRNNQISSLQAGLFDSLTALKRLRLENNDLVSLPPLIFDPLAATLIQLYLFGNHLGCVPTSVDFDMYDYRGPTDRCATPTTSASPTTIPPSTWVTSSSRATITTPPPQPTHPSQDSAVNSSLACCTCPDLCHQVERMQEQIDNLTQSQNEAMLQIQKQSAEMHAQIEHLQANASRTCADGGMEPEIRRDVREWGSDEYDHCEQPFSWKELLAAYKAGNRRSAKEVHGAFNITFKSGGLGNRVDEGGYKTWVCIRDHFCGDPYFCWVYHETRKVFTPWGTARELRLRSVVDDGR